MRWSYKTVHYELKKEGLLGSVFLDESEVEKSLNEYGKAGWELVSMIDTNDGVIAVFKQPISFDDDWESEDLAPKKDMFRTASRPVVVDEASFTNDAEEALSIDEEVPAEIEDYEVVDEISTVDIDELDSDEDDVGSIRIE